MAKKSLNGVLQHICKLAAVQSAHELADHELVQRFVAGKDEAAFTVLVQRHGPMILGVCRRMLGSSHDAEDACQASFLVLAQKAASIRKTTSLSSWLHGVASRVAAKLKRERGRRYKRENDSQPRAVLDPAAEVSWREVQTILDEELERLPDRLRAPLILCYLEGRTRDEAAARLGLSVACLHGRLERGRKALCDRLMRRGVTLSATLVATAIGEGVSGAALSPTVVVSTAKAAVLLGSARALDNGLISTKILSLAQEVSKNMLLTKIKLGLSALLFAGLLVPALGGSLASLGAGQQAEEPRATGPSQAGAGKLLKSPPTAVRETAQPQPNARPAGDERISGRVLDADDKPVAGAKVYLLQWGPAYGLPPDKAPPKVWAETDKNGLFSFTAPRYQGALFVTAAGFGPGWDTTFPRAVIPGQEARPAEDGLVVRLAKDDVPVSGRLLDLQGEPVAGATVRVFALKASPDGSLDKFIEAAKKRPFGQLYNDQQHLVQFNVDGLAHFFPPVTTDKAGRFQIKGVGRERVVDFSAEAPTMETKVLHAVTRPGLGAAEIRIPEGIISFAGGKQKEERMSLYYPPTFTHTADPCRVVTGVVRDKATGKPIAGAVVRGDQPVRLPPYYNRAITDQEGRYRLAGFPLTPGAGRPVVVVALPPDGEPYLALRKTVPADKEAKEAKCDFDLPRGFWLEGQVKDKATGRGIPAQLQYFAPTEWTLQGRIIVPVGDGARQLRDQFGRLTTDNEGKFRLLAGAEGGMLGATAIGEEANRYRIGVAADKIKDLGTREQPGGLVLLQSPGEISVDSFDTLMEVKPEEGATGVRCDLELDPGQTLTVQVRGPDGKPLGGILAYGQFARASFNGWSQNLLGSEFTLYGLEPGQKRTLLLDHPKKNLTARCEIKGDELGPVVVTLQPAATAVGRLVADDGRPLAHAGILVQFRLAKDAPPYLQYSHSRQFKTDAEGKFRLDGLIEGMSYVGLMGTPGYLHRIVDDLSLKSGELKDLGDVKVMKGDSQ